MTNTAYEQSQRDETPYKVARASYSSSLRRSARLLRGRPSVPNCSSLDSTVKPQTTSTTYKSKRPLQYSKDRDEPLLKKPRITSNSYRADSLKFDQIDYWRRNTHWPASMSQLDMMTLKQARPKSNRKRSADGSAISVQSDVTSTRYRTPAYDALLEEHLIYMEEENDGPCQESIQMIKKLLTMETDLPQHSLFSEHAFKEACGNLRGRNEARITRDFGDLIVPSAENLAVHNEISHKNLVETVNEAWTSCVPIVERPQPDFSVGFKRHAFKTDQLDKMKPLLGNPVTDVSYLKATFHMYFPFLTCEIKGTTGTIEVAHRQNLNSTAVALQAVITLLQLVGRQQEAHRKVFVFSVSHDSDQVFLYGHYARIQDANVSYHRHLIVRFNIQAEAGKERWKSYKFVKNVYDYWAPEHLQLLHDLVDQLPAGKSQNAELSQLAETAFEEALSIQQVSTNPPSN